MRINRNNGIMETSPCKDQRQGQGQGLDHKDQDKDKDLTPRTRTRTRTSWTRTPKDKDKDKDLTPKDQDKDKDLKKALKESLRTRINIPAFACSRHSKFMVREFPIQCRSFGNHCSKVLLFRTKNQRNNFRIFNCIVLYFRFIFVSKFIAVRTHLFTNNI